jgi:hypothetical protein
MIKFKLFSLIAVMVFLSLVSQAAEAPPQYIWEYDPQYNEDVLLEHVGTQGTGAESEEIYDTHNSNPPHLRNFCQRYPDKCTRPSAGTGNENPGVWDIH